MDAPYSHCVVLIEPRHACEPDTLRASDEVNEVFPFRSEADALAWVDLFDGLDDCFEYLIMPLSCPTAALRAQPDTLPEPVAA